MFDSKRPTLLLTLSLLVCLWQSAALAQPDSSSSQSDAALLANLSPVSDAMLRSPADKDWLLWRRTYDSQGFSPLDQVNRQNVSQLSLAWRTELAPGPNMATPLVHDGVMFLASTEDTVLALDARSGNELWTYKHESNATPSARIGIALHGEKVLIPTQDLHVVALNSKSGAVLWDHEISANATDLIPYALRGAPLIANGIVIQGVTATMIPEGGFIVGLDINSGEELWRFHTVARPDGPGGNTWNNLPLAERSGGSVWVPGSYEPALDLIYFGTAPTYDTGPLLKPVDIPGVTNDALYTNATIALRPKTGELVWYYQHMANDQWDLDWVYERQIIDLPVNGVSRRVIVTAGKMALYDALDAQTGEYLFSIDVGIQNVVTAIDPITGAKTLHPNATPNSEQGHLICPFSNGGRNWQSAAVNPESKMLYLPLAEICMDTGPTTDQGGLLSTGVTLTPTPPLESDGKFGRLQAINLETRQVAWDFREVVPPTSAVLATAGGLVFGGALDQSLKAFDDRNGDVLWQTDMGDIAASFPITYSVDGKQYIAVVIGQPTIHTNIWIGTVTGFLGQENSPVHSLTREGAAIVVYALN
ncbi:MAG: alcohol dehydrogenase [SAR86 cluster bacterium]|uniref:Alcohol dehydrogenase n=1 Tax=SAR86 cluster bacterium TaxID=2030880 RepID=A0A2A5AXC1_9GAMM|nr:MAG: alcohol dehydrogenase [SAR86 cluster bacterium]